MPDSGKPEQVEIRRCRTLAEAEERALVLAAVGIAYEVVPGGYYVGLYVPATLAARAREELASYERENSPGERRRVFRPFLHGSEAAMVYCAVLFFFFGAARRETFSVDWLAIGAAQAELIRDGAWWRTLTALSLHAELGHLIGNLVFGVVAAVLVAQLIGPGLAWLAIVLSGALGNTLTAFIQSPEHTAIGASTAVFGAVGLLSGYTQRADTGTWRRGLRRWSPVAAGVLLLVFVGLGGERTDIWAHVAGLFVGIVIGLALAQASRDAIGDPRLQWLCGSLACGLLAMAWLFALSVY